MQDSKSENKLPEGETKSSPTSEPGTKEIALQMQRNRMIAEPRGYRFAVSNEQFKTVETEHKKSMDLLNSSANALLGAMESMVPHPESGRALGEYGGTIMRQLAKSICDVIQTKTGVVRNMYSISRDEL